MTQDNDDLLAEVFSVLPTLEGQTDVNGNGKKEQEIVANVRRVSNAFQDFIKSGVVETNVVSYEHHTESHHHVTSHVETHHETVTIGGGVHHENHHETIGNGAVIAEHHEENHGIGHGVSVISTELNPPAAHHEEHHFSIGVGAVPQADDNESVVSVRTGLSEATSVSVHSSVSQKSIQIYADAPVIVKAISKDSPASHKGSVVPESHHSEVAHTHECESTISSFLSTKSNASTLTGSAASGNTAIENYVFVENSEVPHEHHHHHHHEHEVHHQHHTSQDTTTPIAVMKSDPHDALIEEFKARHQRVPSEVSSFVVAPVSQPPPPPTVPPPADSDDESEVVMTVKVTQYEFDSHDVKHAIEHHHEHHTHHEHHEHHIHHDEPVQNGYIHQDEPEYHFEDHTHHNGLDSHVVVGHGAVPHHVDEDEFHFEHVEYHEQVHHQPEPVSLYHDNVSVAPSEPRSEVPPVFFQSPVLARKAPQQVVNHFDSASDVSSHHHHHHHHQEHEHEDVHHIHRELIPNISGPFVRDELRPAHVSEEHRTVTVSKTVSAPVAHVQPVVSHPVVHHHHHEPRGLPRIDHREVLIPHTEEAPVVHKIEHPVEHHHHHEAQHHHHDHHEHHVHNERHLPRSERHYHKHDDQMTEIFSGPSVRDLKSQFEHGGDVLIHYGTHYISHKEQTSAPIHVETLHHHHHHHDEHVEAFHEPVSAPVVVSVGQPRLPHRELKEEHVHHHPEKHIHTHVKEHTHHHHEHKEHYHHHQHHPHHEEPVHQHEEQHHHDHHHEHHEHEHVEYHQHSEHHEHHHEPHVEIHQYVAEEEDQLPVSALLSRYGGGAKLRRPDHAEVISRASSVPNVTVVHEVHHHHVEEQPKSRTVTQSSASTRGVRSQSTYSVQTSQTRSHASTLTQDHHNVVATAPAPVAAARSPVSDHQSLRVVKSVRAFVSEWGQKDFQPPMSPIITVPRLPSSPKSPVPQTIPEPATRKSTVLSEVSNTSHTTHTTHQSQTPEHHAIQHIERALHDDAGSVCSQCTKSNRGKSVSSVASTVTTYTTTSHHQEPVVAHIGEGAHPQIPEVHEEFVLTPLAERRALFEQGLNKSYSINRKAHGELRPMVNVFTD